MKQVRVHDRLADPAFSLREVHQHGARLVNHDQIRALRQGCLGGQGIHALQVERSEDDTLQGPIGPGQRESEIDAGDAGHSADLVFAGAEAARG